MNRREKINKLMTEYNALSKREFIREIRGLDTSSLIFYKNYVDLSNLIKFLSEDPRADRLFILRNQADLQGAMNEVIRLLHNYVASAKSLVDHTRSMYKRLYSKSHSFSDYQSRIDEEFARDPLSQFVMSLRNYCQHYKAPNLHVTTFVKYAGSKPVRTFGLGKEDLNSFKNWSPLARRYLSTIDKETDVREIAQDYFNKIEDFYKWFQMRQEQIHKNELKEFETTEREYLTLMLEEEIHKGFIMYRERIPFLKEELFSNLLSSIDLIEIEKIPKNSKARPVRVIELLEEKNLAISNETKKKIRKLYELQDILPENEGNKEFSIMVWPHDDMNAAPRILKMAEEENFPNA